MRVLYVVNALGAGGAQRSLAEMLPGLMEGGVQPSVACFRRVREGVHDQIVEAGIDVHVLGPARTALPRLGRLAGGADVVHTTLFESDVLGRLAGAGRARVLTSLVNTTYDGLAEANGDVRAWRLEIVRRIDGLTARHLTDGFHAITEAVRDSAVRSLGIAPTAVTVIERGRDESRLGARSPERRARVRRDLGLADDAEVVVHVGRQEPQKGQRDLVLAMARIRHRRPHAVLVLVGRAGRSTPELERLVRENGLHDRVLLLGHREDVPDLLAAADLFAFPSLFEGLGGAVIEAMGLSIPVVATRVPALAEVVEDGGSGLLVPVRDPAALSAAMASVFEQPGRAAAFGARGREIFEDRFTLQRCVARTLAWYDVAGSPRAGRFRRPAPSAQRGRGSAHTILHVVARSQRRGAEVVAADLAAEFGRRGIGGEVVSIGRDINGSTVPGVDPLTSAVRLDGPDTLRAALALRRLVRRRRPDLLLAHGGHAALVAGLATRGTGLPIVWQRILPLPAAAISGGRRRLALVLAARWASGCVVLTDSDRDELARLGHRGLVRKIVNHRPWRRFAGLDRAVARAAVRAELGLGDDTRLLGFLAHLVPQKRPDRVVEVLRGLLTEDLRVHLVVVGDGPLRSAVTDQIARLGLVSHVTLLGHRDDVPRLLAAFDLLLITSDNEGVTGTSIEALMAGCPIVTFDLGGQADVVCDGRTGRLVQAGDVEGLRRAVAGLLADKKFLGEAPGRCRRAALAYTTEAVAGEYLEFFDQLDSEGSRPFIERVR